MRGRSALDLADSILDRPGAGLHSVERDRAFFTAMELSLSGPLQGIPGLGPAQRARILAACEIGKRYRASGAHSQPESKGDQKLAALAKIPAESRCDSQEWLGFVPLHRGGVVGELCIAERGVRTHVNVDPAELFARVLALRPAGIVLFHNHPSGDLTPSNADHVLTRRIDSVCRQLGLRLHAHGIVAASGETWIVI